jgi:phospholipase C
MRTVLRRPASYMVPVLSLLLALGAGTGPILAGRRLRVAMPTTPITHVVIFMLENHNFNSYFGQFPGVQNGVTLSEASNPLSQDIDHSGESFAAAVDGGKMDEFPTRGDVQYSKADLPIWWQYAQQFGLSDNFFSSVATSSTPNHIALITAGQTGGLWVTVNSTSCGSPANEILLSRNTSGNEFYSYPCYNLTNVPQLLASNGLSWRYYNGVPIFDAPSYIQSLYGSPSDIHNPGQFGKDVQTGTLATVSWVVPPAPDDDHPPAPVQPAQNWVSQQINALMNSSYWPHLAIFISWDDWGGFYDPVDPPYLDGLGLGARVPLIVVSPYAKAAYISHQQGEFSSFAKFIEENWGLSSLGQRDALSSTSDLMDCFDFNQTPQQPLLLGQIPFQSGLSVINGTVAPNQSITGAVNPKIGSIGTTFTYSVLYTAGGTPATHNITIDGGSSTPMMDMGAVTGGELYQYKTKLPVGSHTFTFTFSTPSGSLTIPYNNVPFPGPQVYPFNVIGFKATTPTLPGQTVTFSAKYSSPQNKPPTLAEVDIDGVAHTLTSNGSTSYTTGVTYSYATTGLSIGRHYARFRFDDGSGAATYEGMATPSVTPNLLLHSGVNPTSGTATTTFTFSTTYQDAAGVAPAQALVYVDQQPHTMAFVSGSYTAGALYQTSITLAAGSHQFDFVFSDGSSSWADPLAPAMYSGPSVSAAASALAPMSADAATAPVVIAPSHDSDPDYPLPGDAAP